MSARIGSLCSGYGGLDLAVEAVFGGRTVWHCEIEDAPSAILAAHWDVPNHRDLKSVDWSTVEPVDIMTAGYPCQPFSHAGRRGGSDDPRHLWPFVAEAVRRVRPGFVVLENVAGHRTLGFDAVLGDLAEAGYDAQWVCLRAADVGAPHGRERLFILATDTEVQSRRFGDRDDVRLRGYQERSRQATRRSAVAVTVDFGHERSRAARSGGTGSEDRRLIATDATGERRGEGWPESARLERGSDAAQRGDSTAADTYGDGLESVGRLEPIGRDIDGCRGSDIAWGAYEPAIRRWERATGRVAPAPTELAPRGGQRLSPRFVEWMMGLPAGWVTDVQISRNEQLKALGNGVVPQQAVEALRRLLPIANEAAA